MSDSKPQQAIITFAEKLSTFRATLGEDEQNILDQLVVNSAFDTESHRFITRKSADGRFFRPKADEELDGRIRMPKAGDEPDVEAHIRLRPNMGEEPNLDADSRIRMQKATDEADVEAHRFMKPKAGEDLSFDQPESPLPIMILRPKVSGDGYEVIQDAEDVTAHRFRR